jgi:hypothetical protein
MTSNAIIKKSSYNKENEGVSLNMLRKVQKPRKELNEKKFSSKALDICMKENDNTCNLDRESPVGYEKKITFVKDEPLESFRIRETRKTMQTYGAEMIEELKSK